MYRKSSKFLLNEMSSQSEFFVVIKAIWLENGQFLDIIFSSAYFLTSNPIFHIKMIIYFVHPNNKKKEGGKEDFWLD